ncbi:class I SAM-dependent methyltransferase [Candidatus Methylacidiphilum infernorum]|uniref:Class I SAM-dependent methyltransferase n=1 Tax=Candidatus Methylacidiphilum infernorum TaxID=511746 RepID=A0ABX7PU28_9BACT|nr:class I SAM-dependent methyltransferase [Candidatus Methylacidiphilum infernorum]QSR86412.1 class I SAM-dependent methyltransferase [Candidatus Methylacidiphilum infernorum]
MRPSEAPIPLFEKARELYAIARLKFKTTYDKTRLECFIHSLFQDIEEYNRYLLTYSHKSLYESKVFEIGFGPRPYRLLALIGLGIEAWGIDLDIPVLEGTIGQWLELLKKNGLERFLKSFFRFYLFDLKERKELEKSLKMKKGAFTIPKERLWVGDAAELELPCSSFDLIFSEDVFEHIPKERLEILVAKMGLWLKPGGLALIRPMVYTGIAGGHLAEWFPGNISSGLISKKSEPWEHLRKNRFQPNTYLNKLWRKDYRFLFSKHFLILEEKVKYPALGQEWLTEEIKKELSCYPEEELLSNNVLFVLQKPRTG